MSKFNKKDYFNILIVILSFLIFLFLILMDNDVIYGSELDYISQHYMIPDYFRTLFYDTKDIFPSFAMNLGLGQNIFYFSYYGLFSPIILISYLLPGINMAYFIMFSSIAIMVVSIILFYKWISYHFENNIIRFISTFIFMSAVPLMLHSHRHVMFMNYMPFLLYGLFAVEYYVNNNKINHLMISLILIILTSYFFSVPSLLVLFIYLFFLSIKKEKMLRNAFRTLFKSIFLFIIPVLITSFFLMPTLKAILNSRFGSTDSNLLLNFIPIFSFDNLLYSSYAMGLTAVLIPSIGYSLLSKEKHIRLLGIIFLLITFFPIINYVLNGFMYLNAKVFIPFIPLGVFLISNLLNGLINEKIEIKKLAILTIIISIFGCMFYSKYAIFIVDLLFISCVFFLFYRNRKNSLLLLLLIPCIINCYVINSNDTLGKEEVLSNQYNDKINFIVKNIDDDSFYRIADKTNGFYNANNVRNIDMYKSTMYSSLTNKYYKNFMWNEFDAENPNRNHAIFENTNNVLLNLYLGNKYMVSTNREDIFGYEEVNSLDGYNLYKNDNVFSIGYSNNNLMSLKEYRELNFPFNVEALMNYTIIDRDVDSNYVSNIEEITVDNTDYNFELNSEKEFNIKLKNDYSGKLLLIRFDMEYSEKCSLGDTYITINDVSNKLTCKNWKYHNNNYSFEYVLSSNEDLNDLNIKISKGKFVISNIKVYALNYMHIKNITDNHSDFVINKENTSGDVIEGMINVKENGYFNLSVPYDEGFEIFVDDERQNYELVNTAFVGFPINSGLHSIKIVYTAPWLKIGKLVSLFGVLLFGIANFVYKKRSKKI